MGTTGRRSSRQDDKTPFHQKAGLYLAVAFELPGTILAGLLFGYLLDNYLGTSPWLLITLTAIAFAGAFTRLIQWGKFFKQQSDGKRREEDDPAH